jgi:hypothetical protein
LNQAQGQGVIWVPSSTTIVFALNGPSWQGGHGKIHKVRIENFDHVPLYIEFASKKLKTKDNYYAQCQLFMEALVCSTNHLGVTKFMPSMQKPCRHTNCGGTKAHVGRC